MKFKKITLIVFISLSMILCASSQKKIEEARKKDIKILSLTDHDSISGLEKMIHDNVIWNGNLRIIPGIEFNTTDEEARARHIVGYFPGKRPEVLSRSHLGKRCVEIKRAREHRMRKIIEKFNKFFKKYHCRR